jgi:hypothetical protein
MKKVTVDVSVERPADWANKTVMIPFLATDKTLDEGTGLLVKVLKADDRDPSMLLGKVLAPTKDFPPVDAYLVGFPAADICAWFDGGDADARAAIPDGAKVCVVLRGAVKKETKSGRG